MSDRDGTLDRALNCLTIAAASLYLMRDLVTRGLAVDGLIYANIAIMLAETTQSVWALPRYDGEGSFTEHLPLGIWLQSLWVHLAGTEFWMEKSYSALLGALIGCLTAALWQATSGSRSYWWPWLLLLTMPVSTFTIKNNYLETPLTVCTLLAVWLAWRAVQAGQTRAVCLLQLALVAALCTLALLLKGPTGLFPLVAPAAFALALQNSPLAGSGGPSRGWPGWVYPLLICFALFGLFLTLLLGFAEIRDSVIAWWQTQLWPSVVGSRPIDNGRAFQVGELLRNLAVPGALVAVLGWRQRKRAPRVAWALLAIGLAASLPLLVSARQFKHYLLPALPCLALGLALMAQPKLPAMLRAGPVYAIAFGLLLVSLGRGWLFYAGTGKDAAQMRAAAQVAEAIAPQRRVLICAQTQAYTLMAYLYRQYRIESLRADGIPVTDLGSQSADWCVCSVASGPNQLPLANGLYLSRSGAAP